MRFKKDVFLFIKRKLWDITRFGFSPRKLFYRTIFMDKKLPKVFTISIPKSGTHLLERLLCLYPQLYRKYLPTLHPGILEKYGGLDAVIRSLRSAQIVVSHLHYSRHAENLLNDFNVKTLFTVRDPRDIVVSGVFYILRTPEHKMHPYFMELPDNKSRFLLSINGSDKIDFPSLRERLYYFDGWLESSAKVIKFEDLIGREGGAETHKTLRNIYDIFDYLEIEVEYRIIEKIENKLYSNVSPTFRKGKIGQWKNYFDGEINNLINSQIGDYLDRYGYTK